MNDKGAKEPRDLIKREHTRKIWRSINSACQRQCGGEITAVEINMIGHWKLKAKKSEAGVVIFDKAESVFSLHMVHH